MKLVELMHALDDAKRGAESTRNIDALRGTAMDDQELSGNMAFLAAQAQHAGLDFADLLGTGEVVRDGTMRQWARAWYEGQLTPTLVASAYASALLDGVIIGALFAQHQLPLSAAEGEELREDPRVGLGGWIDNRDGTVVRVRGIDARDYVVYERPRTPAPDSATDEERHTIDCFLEHHTHVDAVPMLGGDGA